MICFIFIVHIYLYSVINDYSNNFYHLFSKYTILIYEYDFFYKEKRIYFIGKNIFAIFAKPNLWECTPIKSTKCEHLR